MTTNRKFLARITMAAMVAAGSQAALADDVDCPPDLGAVEIDGNVLVAAPCVMTDTVVKGNVHLYEGGSLIARNVSIDGNIQAENAFEVDVTDSEIGGSIQLDDLVGDVTRIENNFVDGNIQLKANRPALDVVGNTVGADIQAFSNSGGIDISANVVDGNLQCKSNEPAPTGGNNTVQGNKEDQCATLQPRSSTPVTGGGSSGSTTATGSSTESSATTASGGGGTGWIDLALILGFLGVAQLWRRLGFTGK